MLDIEAVEYFESKVAGLYMGEKTPIFIHDHLNDLFY
jgi:hypothetical protein